MGFALGGEAVVEDLVEAFGFGLVAVYGVGDFFGGILEGKSVFCGFWDGLDGGGWTYI